MFFVLYKKIIFFIDRGGAYLQHTSYGASKFSYWFGVKDKDEYYPTCLHNLERFTKEF